MSTSEIAWSSDGEQFYPELRQAICLLEAKVGDVVYIGDAIRKPASAYVSAFEVETLLEGMSEQATYEVNEFADNFPDVDDDQATELLQLIREWADKNLTVTFFTVENIRQHTLTAEDIGAAA